MRIDEIIPSQYSFDPKVMSPPQPQQPVKPNGPPPLTSSPAFQAWFRGSRVVDRQGRPLRVFHGTTAPEDFTEFSVGQDVSQDEDQFLRTGSGADPRTYLGSHFARETHVANKFARGMYGEREGVGSLGGRVIPVYLRIVKPYRTSDSAMLDQMLGQAYSNEVVDAALEQEAPLYKRDIDQMGLLYDRDPKIRSKINNEALSLSTQAYDPPDLSLAREMADIYRNRIIRRGYDGIIYKNEIEGGLSYIVFDPRQVKSALAGAFDSNSTNMSESSL